MRFPKYLAFAALAALVSSCDIKPTDNTTPPSQTSMTFKQGARYQYESYHTDAASGATTDSSKRTRTWTLLNKSASVHGEAGVAVFVDSVFSLGSFTSVGDSVYLQQKSGNDVYRYASLLPELDLSILPFEALSKGWQHEARLSATSAAWAVSGDTMAFMIPTGVPSIDTVYLSVQDDAVASAVEDITIDGTKYSTTKTTHTLSLKVFVVVKNIIPFPPTIPIVLKTESLSRITWMAPGLGAIVKETREGKVLDVSAPISGQNASFSIPIPGYYSAMTKIIATGN